LTESSCHWMCANFVNVNTAEVYIGFNLLQARVDAYGEGVGQV